MTLPPLLKECLEGNYAFDETGGKVQMHSNVSLEEATELNKIVEILKPQCSAEVGFARGISALAILGAVQANGVGHHHVMDPFQAEYQNAGIAMVKRAGLDQRFTFHRKFAEEVVPSLPRLQFAFIDASHLFDLTLCEFVLVDKKLDVGGVVAFHDMWMGSQQKLIRYLLANRKYEIYSEARATPGRPNKGNPLKNVARGLCKMLPGAENIFAPEFLKPWGEFALPNLVALRKTAEDKRDWKFHAPF